MDVVDMKLSPSSKKMLGSEDSIKTIIEMWHVQWRDIHGRLHRAHGPADYDFFVEGGDLMFEYYYHHGILHREDGPAAINYNWGELVAKERYCQHGELHRLDGPASIDYNQSGEIIGQFYYINGDYFYEKDYWNMVRKLTLSPLYNYDRVYENLEI